MSSLKFTKADKEISKRYMKIIRRQFPKTKDEDLLAKLQICMAEAVVEFYGKYVKGEK